MDVKTLYDEKREWGWTDYDPIINAIGTVVAREDDQDYQGDTHVLYRDGDRWGFVVIGWGSCSGCDALQACGSIEEVQALADEIQRDVVWLSRAEMIEHLKSRGDANTFFSSSTSWPTFRDKALAMLGGGA